VRSALLRGRDHQRVGGLELVGEGPAAIALSRGGAGKTYYYTDPNEDCVAFALGAGGQLLIAADGHHGAHGSEHAVRAILKEFAGPWTAEHAPATGAEAWREQALDALECANRAILEIAGQLTLAPAPTTLVVALMRPGDDLLLHLSMGDSHLFAVEEDSAIELAATPAEWKYTPFLGYEQATREAIGEHAILGQRSLVGLRAVVLATDGLSEPGIGVSHPARSVHQAVSRAAEEAAADLRPVDVCRTVVEAAMSAHQRQRAGDNMGCSVVWLEA